MSPVPEAGALERLAESTTALIRTADGLSAEDLAAPSLLPGWSRSHVLAHLALNGEALAAVLADIAHERPDEHDPIAMYRSDEARDADIDELAAADPPELRRRLLAAGTAFTDALPRVPADGWERVVPRTPGGSTFRADEIVAMRHREVEIHHADLGAGYGPADWPPEFVRDLLDVVTVDRAGDGPFTVRATDLDRTWTVGAGGGGPVVSGSGADLGWWLTGRGRGEGLEADGGPLPALGPWRRQPARSSR
jgi:maleylpyruvate isomerase